MTATSLVFSAERDRFEVKFEYMERSAFDQALQIVKSARFRWDPDQKTWWSTVPEEATALLAWADNGVRERLEELAEKQNQSLIQSKAESADVDLPKPDGLDYFPFQKAGILYALDRPATLFGDEMGLGKTIEALGYINCKPKIRKILVICPASLKINWVREAQTWLTREFTYGIGSGQKIPKCDFLVINYDVLRVAASAEEKELSKQINKLEKHPELVIQGDSLLLKKDTLTQMKAARLENVRPELDRDWDLIIMDEVHAIKNPRSQRSKLASMLCGWIPAKLFLTGTPILNRPKELYPILANLDPGRWPSFWRFVHRYCGAHKDSRGHWDFNGSSHLDELQRILRETVMVRRLKKDVLPELPAKLRKIVELDADKFNRVMAEEDDYESKNWTSHFRHLRQTIAFAKASENKQKYDAAVDRL